MASQTRPLAPAPASLLDELVDLGPAEAGQPRHRHADDAAAFGEGRLEDAEAGRCRQLAQVVQLHAVAHVRLVRAEAVDGLAIGEAWEGVIVERSAGDHGARHGQRHLLHPGHHVFLAHEAHLQVELRELRLAVAAQVLVAEAAGDLEVAVEAADHQQLLELLRALRQGVDVARLETRGHDEVARTLGRGLDEQRRLDLHEAGGMVDVADGLHEPAAREDALLQGLTAQVQVAVLEPQRLVDVGLGLVDHEGRVLRLREHLDVRGPQLHLGRWACGVLRTGQAWRDACR